MKKIILLIIEKIRKALKVDEKGNSFGWGKGMLLLVALMMVECYQANGYYEKKNTPVGDYILETIKYQDCEYVILQSNTHRLVTIEHKGNCKFCKERRQKELKELVKQLKKE